MVLIKIIFLPVLLGMSFSTSHAQSSADYGAPKFVPPEGKKLFFIGQDLASVGGLATFNNGYIDHFPINRPAGVTTYTSIPSLNGLRSRANWGAGTVQAQAYLDDQAFNQTAIAIGLHLVGQLRKIARGKHDTAVKQLALWIKESKRPVFLRIGYEFEGEWNNYKPKDFVKAWQHIVHIFDEQEVKNVAYVWQSAGINAPNLSDWYPGDEYVNWVGYSHFDGPNPGQSMRDFAVTHQKPIMIAEAAPRVDLKQVNGETIWADWYRPLLDQVYNSHQIKALAYINAFWDQQPMWIGQGWGDSRVQINEQVRQLWAVEMGKSVWVAGSDVP
ncbi:MAG: glycosyl hydrolase, partial [Bacteroidota bacterium]